jgi:protocatechuate 3,4-dioxygenase beta subunit
MRVVRSFGVFLLVVFLVIMFLPAEPAAAQTASSGAVAGTVVDSSGAVVPNATVTLTNTETNAESQATTNAQGAYVFPNVLPGPYRLTVKQAGFRTATISSLKVEVNRS